MRSVAARCRTAASWNLATARWVRRCGRGPLRGTVPMKWDMLGGSKKPPAHSLRAYLARCPLLQIGVLHWRRTDGRAPLRQKQRLLVLPGLCTPNCPGQRTTRRSRARHSRAPKAAVHQSGVALLSSCPVACAARISCRVLTRSGPVTDPMLIGGGALARFAAAHATHLTEPLRRPSAQTPASLATAWRTKGTRPAPNPGTP